MYNIAWQLNLQIIVSVFYSNNSDCFYVNVLFFNNDIFPIFNNYLFFFIFHPFIVFFSYNLIISHFFAFLFFLILFLFFDFFFFFSFFLVKLIMFNIRNISQWYLISKIYCQHTKQVKYKIS